LPGSTAAPNASDRIITTDSTDGTQRYRVLASAVSGGGTLVLAFPLGDAENALSTLLLIEGIVTVAVLAGVAALALWLVRLGMRPLTRMELAAERIAEGDLSHRVDPSDERTEVGRLGRALNAMLTKIEAAFAERRASEDRLRRFVADASHELRTPLTSIRGYAELFGRADVKPEDLAKSMRRIEEESTRMSELVEELLLLARLDQGRALERAPLDLARIAADAVEDARAVQPERRIEIDQNGSVMMEGDEARIRQVAANLISNALVHTPATARVRVRVAKVAEDAVLEVSDDGPGLAPDQAAKVFDRFFRVDPARSRQTGSAGLGLSIVAAIVHAHGGEVSLDSAPGAGARFIVRLPRNGHAG
jgi:two-component system OmpR family sensor kinase